jgi:hypothetical protein
MAFFDEITNCPVAVSLDETGERRTTTRLQRFAHRVDWWLAIEPDGKRERALM